MKISEKALKGRCPVILRRVGAFGNACRTAGGVSAPLHHRRLVLGEKRLDKRCRPRLIICSHPFHRGGVELFDGQTLIINEYTKDTAKVHEVGENVFISFDATRISLYDEAEEVLSK